MKKVVSFFVIFCWALQVFAQKQDNTWLLGYAGGNQSPMNDSFGLSILRFDSNNSLSIENNQISTLNFRGTNSAICDSVGNLLFYTNGEKIYNFEHLLVQNGNNLNTTNQNGAVQPQGALSLPNPGKPNSFTILISEIKVFSPQLVAGIKLNNNIFEIDPIDEMESEVTLKNESIIEDTLEYGQIAAVKHGNGLDWWILVPESHSNRYFTLLFNSSGLFLTQVQGVGDVFYAGLGQAVFSPNGAKYARANGITLTDPSDLFIYNFDRCNGQLSNPIHLEYETWGLGTGCAFSPNSRFLYACNASYIFQYDLEAPDISASKTLVAEWDGYIHAQHFFTTFSVAQLAPDGKIYISTAGSTPFLHIIEHPDRKGLACQVIQRGVYLPTYNSYSIPNFPNFRLGSIDGSSCDTLGFNNHPLCNWRWEQEDTLHPLMITYTDLSSYEPSIWSWDFGDGTTSQDTSPIHTYLMEGTYNVCLIISNQFSSDTMCQMLHLGTSNVEAPKLEAEVQLYPNPFLENLSVLVSSMEPKDFVFHLHDQVGREVLWQPLPQGITETTTEFLPPGMYFWEVTSGKIRIHGGIVIKVR